MRRPEALLAFLVFAAIGAGGLLYGIHWRRETFADADRMRYLDDRVQLLEDEKIRLEGIIDRLQRAGAVDDPDAVIRNDLEIVASEMRKLPWVRRPRYKIVTRAGIGDLVRERWRGTAQEAEIAAIRMRALAAIGLVEEGAEWGATVAGLFVGEATAWYDRRAGIMHVARGAALEEPNERALLIYELASALADQHFDLASLPGPGGEGLARNSDLELARLALAGGDASLLAARYNIEFGSPLVAVDNRHGESGALRSLAGNLGQRLSPTDYFARAILFAGSAGRLFAFALYEQGGFADLDEAHRAPPSSSAEILHPELYRSGGATPERFHWEQEAVALPGRKLLWSDVAGELGIRVLLERHLGQGEVAADAARGWVGDRYLVFGKREPGGKTELYWASAWSSEAEADEFVEVLGRALAARYALKQPLRHSYDGERFLSLTRGAQPLSVVLIDAASSKGREQLAGLGL
ncbi:MAG: hypothetical protein ACC661_06530 [Verrucomicrobiales bacterium]